ncbi:MAG: ABC transporter permease, partial [Pirellulaceae bacterium]
MTSSNKILGILLLLIYVCVVTALLNDAFIKPYNLQNLLRSSSMFAIIGIGAVLVIVTGGIDLSTGSLIGLVGCTMIMTLKSWSQYPPGENGAWLVQLIGIELLAVVAGWVLWDTLWRRRKFLSHARRPKFTLLLAGILMLVFSFWLRGSDQGQWLSMAVAVGVSLWLSMHLGLLHGLMITKLGLQPFVVTLCGLMIYRGLSRYLTGDKTQGLGTEYNDSLRLLAIGKPCTATAVMLVFGLALVLFGIWKSFFSQRSRNEATSRTHGLLLLFTGMVMAVVASSRYWDGWTVEWGTTFAQIAGIDWKFFTLDLPERAIARPAVLMGFAWLPALLSFLWLAVLTAGNTLQDNNRQSLMIQRLLPLLSVGVAVAALLAVMNWIGGQTITLTDMKSAFFSADTAAAGDRFFLGMNVILWQMLGVFFTMGVLMGGVLWLGKSWIRDAGNLPRSLWVLTLFFTVMWLLSKTAIHETVVQTPFFFLVAIGALAALFLNKTV